MRKLMISCSIVLSAHPAAFSQSVKTPQLVEAVKPVVNAEGNREDMVFLFECGAAWGDYDNDGYFDLITAGAGHSWVKTTILYRNNRDGSLSQTDHPFPALQNASVVWLDYNNDGNLDLFLSGIDDLGAYAGLFKNLGPENNYRFEEVFENTFKPTYNSGGNKGNRYAIAGDYDNDGWTDLYIQGINETDAHAYLYKNEKGLSFSTICPVGGLSSFLPLYANTAAFGDYDNDGFLDILAGGYSTIPERNTTGAYYKNKGDGTFDEAVLFEGGVHGEVAWCDYNNDGRLDFLITGYSFLEGVGWQADLFENKGDGTFQRRLPSDTGLPATQDCSVACGDVNNDGFEDILFSYSHPNALFINNFGKGSYTRLNLPYGEDRTHYDQNGGMVCLVDFDRDNQLDVFTIGYGGNFLPGLLKNKLAADIPENNPPEMPGNLSVDWKGEGTVLFSWNAPHDDLTPSEAIRYNLFVKNEDNGETRFVIPADIETGRLKVNENLPYITSNRYPMTGLEEGRYTFGVQAIDNGKLAGLFATKTFTIGGSNLQHPEPEALASVYREGDQWIVSSKTAEWDDLRIFNAQGAVVETGKKASSRLVVRLLDRGVYIVRIHINNELIIKKIVL